MAVRADKPMTCHTYYRRWYTDRGRGDVEVERKERREPC